MDARPENAAPSMTEPAISVVISTRNRVAYLPEVLRSLAAQESADPFEVIVVDNGSTDGTGPFLAEWCRTNPRFRTASEPRPGLSRGKNAGIRLARGNLLLFTDDDMRLDPRWVESYRQLFAEQRSDVSVAGGPIVPIPSDLGAWPKWLQDDALHDAGLLHHGSQRALSRFEYVWGGNMAVARSVFDRFGLFDE